MSRRAVVYLAIGIVVFAVLVTGLLNISRGTVQINVASYSTQNMTVKVNGAIINPVGPGGALYTKKVFPGKANIEIESEKYSFYTEQKSIGFRGVVEVKPELAQKEAKDIASTLINNADLSVSNEKSFGDNWVVFTVSSKDTSGSDGLIVIGRYNNAKNDWEVVEEGTSILADSLVGAPVELIQYVGTL